jgi:hypothetical protein
MARTECRVTIKLDLFYFICNGAVWSCVSIISARAVACTSSSSRYACTWLPWWWWGVSYFNGRCWSLPGPGPDSGRSLSDCKPEWPSPELDCQMLATTKWPTWVALARLRLKSPERWQWQGGGGGAAGAWRPQPAPLRRPGAMIQAKISLKYEISHCSDITSSGYRRLKRTISEWKRMISAYDITSSWYQRQYRMILIWYHRQKRMIMTQERLFIIAFLISYVISYPQLWYHVWYHCFLTNIIDARKAKRMISYMIS